MTQNIHNGHPQELLHTCWSPLRHGTRINGSICRFESQEWRVPFEYSLGHPVVVGGGAIVVIVVVVVGRRRTSPVSAPEPELEGEGPLVSDVRVSDTVWHEAIPGNDPKRPFWKWSRAMRTRRLL